MSDDFPGFQDDGKKTPKPQMDFPGFAEDEAAPPPKKKPAAQSGAEAPFNAFADVDMESDATPGAAPPAPGATAGGAATGDDDQIADADVQPGQGKDLWPCPHCGAKNKPKRDTCRACGKSPAEPVAKPWFMNPAILGGFVAVIVLLVVVLFMMSGPDYGLASASGASIDDAARLERSGGPTEEAVLGTFTATGRFAVCGRLYQVTLASESTNPTLVLALGPNVRERGEKTDKIGSKGNALGFTTPLGFTEVPAVTLHLANEHDWAAKLEKGMVVSVAGYHGQVEGVRPGDGYVVYVLEKDQQND